LSRKSKILGKNADLLRRFFDLDLREIFSLSGPLVSYFAEKNATPVVKEEGVGAAPYRPPLPPALWRKPERDSLIR
jgi:hypothetical protein